MSDAKTSATKTVTDATFADEVLLSEKPVLVDFWAAWCGPCKMVAPVLEEIAAANGDKITIAKLDADNNPETSKHYGILSLPTMVLFQGARKPSGSSEQRAKRPSCVNYKKFFNDAG